MQSGVSFGLSAHRAGVSLVRSRICCRLGSSSLGFTGFGSGLGVSGVSTGGVGNLGCTGQLGASTTTSGVVGGEGRRRTGVGGDGEGGVAGRGGGGAGALGKESRAGGGGRLNGTSSSSSHSLKLLSSSSLSKLCNKTSLKNVQCRKTDHPPTPVWKIPKKNHCYSSLSSHLQSWFLLALHIGQEVVGLPLQLLGHLAASLLTKIKLNDVDDHG